MAKRIIAFTGQCASGKGTAAAYFVKKHGAVVFRFSTMLRDILDRLYLEHSRDNLQDLSTILRGRFGQDLMAKVMAHDAERVKAPLVIVDGARRPEDIEYLRRLNGFTLVAVSATPEIRFQRMTRRGENPDDATKTWEEFMKEEHAESELLIPRLMNEADFTIDNNGDTAALLKQLQDIYNKITAHDRKGTKT